MLCIRDLRCLNETPLELDVPSSDEELDNSGGGGGGIDGCGTGEGIGLVEVKDDCKRSGKFLRFKLIRIPSDKPMTKEKA